MTKAAQGTCFTVVLEAPGVGWGVILAVNTLQIQLLLIDTPASVVLCVKCQATFGSVIHSSGGMLCEGVESVPMPSGAHSEDRSFYASPESQSLSTNLANPKRQRAVRDILKL